MYLTTIKLEESETINYMVPRTYQYVTTIVTISTKGMIYKPVLHHKKMYWMQKTVPFAKEHISKNHKMYLLTKAFMKTNEQSSYSRYFENQLNLPKKRRKAVIFVDVHTYLVFNSWNQFCCCKSWHLVRISEYHLLICFHHRWYSLIDCFINIVNFVVFCSTILIVDCILIIVVL